MLLVAGGVVASAVLVPRAIHAMHPFAFQPLTTAGASQRTVHRGLPRHRIRRAMAALPHARRIVSSTTGGSLALLERVGLESAAGVLLIGVLMLVLVARRVRRRGRRDYALYELHLSTHDQAKGQDVEDMVESIANIVRAWPSDRVRHGQPYVALELICGTAPDAGRRLEMEWSINVRCEPESVSALDGAISAAYPDVRLGRTHGEQPRPRPGVLREPGYVMRFSKERSFVYSLIATGEEQASSPLEQIARAQVAVAAPSVVRFQLTPTPSRFEELARRLYRRQETKLARHERLGLRKGGVMSTFNRAEMRAAERTQNRSLFWLETVVAADTREACKTVAAAIQSRRGENRLHRRWMILRQSLCRRRFPRAVGPLIPSFRSLVSAAEVAHLLELPSARMKGVPVRRVTIPRIPAPPEVVRGTSPRRPGSTRTGRLTPATNDHPAGIEHGAETRARST